MDFIDWIGLISAWIFCSIFCVFWFFEMLWKDHNYSKDDLFFCLGAGLFLGIWGPSSLLSIIIIKIICRHYEIKSNDEMVKFTDPVPKTHNPPPPERISTVDPATDIRGVD